MSQNELIAIENKITLINQYEAMAKDAAEKADAIKSEIKSIMSERGLEQIITPNFIVRWVDVISRRFDTKSFKKMYGEELYTSFCKQVASKKFTITQ